VRVLVLCIALAALARPARADNIDSLVTQLANDDSDRVRLSAALNLVKLNDSSAKIVKALAKALTSDSDKDVRAACAVGLGKLVTPRSPLKDTVLKALQQAASSDSSDFVKQQAQKAIKTITGDSGGSASSNAGGGGGVYVNLGPMSSKTGGNDTKLKALMVKVATATMAKAAPSMLTSWPGGAPSKAALAAKGVSGFYVDGTLNALQVKTSGGGATISCKVSMLLADFPDKNMFGFLNGGASVTAGASASDQELASEDCVQAVIENLIANKIVPTIKSKVP
jgi:hypothetical protein